MLGVDEGMKPGCLGSLKLCLSMVDMIFILQSDLDNAL